VHVVEMRDDNENEGEENGGINRSPADTYRSGMPSTREHQQLSTHPDEDTSTFTEQPIDDRVYLINPVEASSRIWVLHQAATRVLRKDMALVLKK
jgi:hypothetical protein